MRVNTVVRNVLVRATDNPLPWKTVGPAKLRGNVRFRARIENEQDERWITAESPDVVGLFAGMRVGDVLLVREGATYTHHFPDGRAYRVMRVVRAVRVAPREWVDTVEQSRVEERNRNWGLTAGRR